jgi:hypothetical protein
VIQDGEGTLVVVRRPKRFCHAAEYLPCKNCFGFYKKDTLYKHGCLWKTSDTEKGAVKSGLMMISHLLPRNEIDPELRKLMDGMRETAKNPGMLLSMISTL